MEKDIDMFDSEDLDGAYFEIDGKLYVVENGFARPTTEEELSEIYMEHNVSKADPYDWQ